MATPDDELFMDHGHHGGTEGHPEPIEDEPDEEMPAAPEAKKPNKLAALAGAGFSVLFVAGIGGYILYSKLSKPEAQGFPPAPAVAAPSPMQNPYESPAPVPATQADLRQPLQEPAPANPQPPQIAVGDSTQMATAPAPTITVATPPAGPAGSDTPAPLPARQEPATPALGAAVAGADPAAVEALGKRLEQFAGRVDSIEAKVGDLSEKIDRIPARVAASKAVKEPEGEAKETVKPKKPAAAPKKPASTAKEAPVSEEFRLQAVIVGQAWLLGVNGRAEVVREGDRLADGTKVLKIDAAKGVVSTSRGDIKGE